MGCMHNHSFTAACFIVLCLRWLVAKVRSSQHVLGHCLVGRCFHSCLARNRQEFWQNHPWGSPYRVVCLWNYQYESHSQCLRLVHSPTTLGFILASASLLHCATRTGPWMIGSASFFQKRLRSIVWVWMDTNGRGRSPMAAYRAIC